MWNFTQTLSKKANENAIKYSPLKNLAVKAFLLALFPLAYSSQATAGTFTANQSGPWTTPATWTITNPTAANVVPGASDDVIIPTGYVVDISAAQSCNNLNLYGALFSSGNKAVSVGGNVEFAGSMTSKSIEVLPTSTFTFKTLTNITLPNMSFGNVVIDVPAGITVTTDIISKTGNPNNAPVILGSLTVTSGNLMVNSILDITGMSVAIINPSSSITFGGTANIIRTPGSQTNFIAMSKGGRLIMQNIGKGSGNKRQGNVEYPIGTLNGSYTPVLINNKEFNPATIKGDFGVSVVNGVYLQGTDGTLITSNVVNKTWMVSLTSGDADASVTLKWNAGDELTGFAGTGGRFAQFSNNVWTFATGTTFDPVNRTIKRTGLLGTAATNTVNFPLFAVQNGPFNPLPVELVSFTAVKKASEVTLAWETASEKNNQGFEVQSSADGKHFEALGFVASQNGNANFSQRYAYSDKIASKEGLMYYRLKQINLDGTVAFYEAKVVDLGKLYQAVKAYPNPFQDQFRINLQVNANEPAEILVTDMAGRTVYHQQQQLLKGENNLNVALNNYPAGMYLVKTITGNQTFTSQLIKE